MDLNNIFTYHAPSEVQLTQINTIRSTALAFSKLIVENTPPGADQTAAIRKLREVVMTANAAIVLNGNL